MLLKPQNEFLLAKGARRNQRVDLGFSSLVYWSGNGARENRAIKMRNG